MKHLLTSSFVGLHPQRSRLDVKSENLVYVQCRTAASSSLISLLVMSQQYCKNQLHSETHVWCSEKNGCYGQRPLLWALCVVMPSVCTIWPEMILNSRSRFSIPISNEIVGIASCCFLIHAKVSIFREMIIILLEHRHLVRFCNVQKIS